MDLKLLEFEQTIEDTGKVAPFKEVQYKGLAPALVREDLKVRVITQTGRAVAEQPMIAPAPIVDNPIYMERPKIKRHLLRVHGVKRWETTWLYIFAVDDDQADAIDYAAAEAWPAAPEYAT